jgi:hypothetical protein
MVEDWGRGKGGGGGSTQRYFPNFLSRSLERGLRGVPWLLFPHLVRVRLVMTFGLSHPIL